MTGFHTHQTIYSLPTRLPKYLNTFKKLRESECRIRNLLDFSTDSGSTKLTVFSHLKFKVQTYLRWIIKIYYNYLERERERERDAERLLDLERERLRERRLPFLSSIKRIRRPFNSVSSNLSMAFFISLYVANSMHLKIKLSTLMTRKFNLYSFSPFYDS